MDSDDFHGRRYAAVMNIGIDVREACHEQSTGKGKWTFGFVSELLKRGIDVTLFSDSEIPLEWHQARVIYFPAGLRWHLYCARYLFTVHPIDVYVSPTSFIVPFLVGRRVKTIPIIHDLIAFFDPTHEKRASRIERLTLPRTLRCAHNICTVSESTKHDLIGRFPSIPSQNITVIFAAAMNFAHPQRQLDRKIILSIGTLCPRKNQLRLLHAFALLPSKLRSEHPLMLVGGRGWNDAAIMQSIQKVQHVEWKGYCTDAEVLTLWSHSCVFAFPSLYEGFGLPVLDAMHMGVPVLCSDRGSLAEVAGDAAELVDPESVESIRDGLQRLLTDSDLRDRLASAGQKRARLFSWERTVDLFLAAL